MGTSLPAKKYTKKNPTVLRLSFEGTGGATQFIDTAQSLSAINRRAYAQGAYYYINSVELYNNEDAFVDLHTVPDTWMTREAWKRGKSQWDRMNEMAFAAAGSRSIAPKYHDFKVYMSDRHRLTVNMTPQLYDINSLNGGYSGDEWAYSKFVSADDDGDLEHDPGTGHATAINQEADDFYVHMLGPHVGSAANWTSVGLIQSYAATRARPQAAEPNTSPNLATDPIANVFDFSSEEQINDLLTNLDSDNDQPPYDHDNYVGGGSVISMQHVARLATSVSSGRVTKASGFCAPFGLICVDPQDTATAWRLVINIAQGTYKGVYAERC